MAAIICFDYRHRAGYWYRFDLKNRQTSTEIQVTIQPESYRVQSGTWNSSSRL